MTNRGSKALFGAYNVCIKETENLSQSRPLRFLPELNRFEVAASVSDPYFLSSEL